MHCDIVPGNDEGRAVVAAVDEAQKLQEQAPERMLAAYNRRAPVVEGAWGIRQFYHRGFEKVRQEGDWICLSCNLGKLLKLLASSAGGPGHPPAQSAFPAQGTTAGLCQSKSPQPAAVKNELLRINAKPPRKFSRTIKPPTPPKAIQQAA